MCAAPAAKGAACEGGDRTRQSGLRTVRTTAAVAALCLVASVHAPAQPNGPFGTAQLQISGARLTLYADALTTDAEQTINVGEAALVRTCYGAAACGTAAAGRCRGSRSSETSRAQSCHGHPVRDGAGRDVLPPRFPARGRLPSVEHQARRDGDGPRPRERGAVPRNAPRPADPSRLGHRHAPHARGPSGARNHDHAAGLQRVHVRGRFRVLGDHREDRASRPLHG